MNKTFLRIVRLYHYTYWFCNIIDTVLQETNSRFLIQLWVSHYWRLVWVYQKWFLVLQWRDKVQKKFNFEYRQQKHIQHCGYFLGQGTMALCTALSSSTFDVLVCLGAPWFIKGMWFHKVNSSASIDIHSKSLDDSAIAVMISTAGFMILICAQKFALTKRVCNFLRCYFHF